MMNVNLDESSTLNRMLISCIIFKEMVVGTFIHRTLCGGGFNNVTMLYGDFGLLGQPERPKLQPIAED